MNTSKQLKETIEELDKGMRWLESVCKDRQVTDTKTSRISLSLSFLQVTQLRTEHILFLLSKNRPSGAFALARSVFESYVRAVYIKECASDDDLKAIIDESKKLPRITVAIESLISKDSYHVLWIKNIREELDSLNDWVHAGVKVYKFHCNAGEIEPNYSLEEQIKLLETVVKPTVIGSGVEVIGLLGVLQFPNDLSLQREIAEWRDKFVRKQY